MTSTSLDTPKKAIVMKSGLALWISTEKADQLEQALVAPGFQHFFVKLQELGQTINTSQVEGIYSMEKYDEILRIKSGSTKCAYGNWHDRREKCECRAEFFKKQSQLRTEREKFELYLPMNDAQRAQQAESMRWMTEEGALNGSSLFRGMFALGRKEGRVMRRASVGRWERENNKKADLEGIVMEKRGISASPEQPLPHSPTGNQPLPRIEKRGKRGGREVGE